MEITPVKRSAPHAHAMSPLRETCVFDEKEECSSSSSFSLELVYKKREILQAEATRLKKCLQARTELMCQLRQKNEALVTQNGSMEQRLKGRNEKLALLQTALQDATCGDDDHMTEDSTATDENIQLCGELLAHLEVHSEKLARTAMESEETLQLHVQSLQATLFSHIEMKQMKLMLREDIISMAAELEMVHQETMAEEDHLNSISVQLEMDKLILKKKEAELADVISKLTDNRAIADNAATMAVEDVIALHRRLDAANAELRLTEDLMRKSGAALPEDFEIEATAQALTDKHTKLGAGIAQAKIEKREALMRRKQEQDLQSIIMANIAAREDQLKWMNQQYCHITKEREFLMETQQAQRRAFDHFREGYTQQIADVEQQLAQISAETKAASTAIDSASIEAATLKKDLDEQLAELRAEQALHSSKRDDLRLTIGDNEAKSILARTLRDSLEATREKNNRLAESVGRIELACEDELTRMWYHQEQLASFWEDRVTHDKARTDMIDKARAKIIQLRGHYITIGSPIKDTTTSTRTAPSPPSSVFIKQSELSNSKTRRNRSKASVEKKHSTSKPTPNNSRKRKEKASSSTYNPMASGQAPSEKVLVGRLEAVLHSEEPNKTNTPVQKPEAPALRPKSTKTSKRLVLSQTLRTKARKPGQTVDWSADDSFSFS